MTMRNELAKVNENGTLTALGTEDTAVSFGADEHTVLVITASAPATLTVRGGNGPCAVPDRSYALPEGTCLLKLESAGFKQLSGANKGKILLCASEAGKVSYGICTVV